MMDKILFEKAGIELLQAYQFRAAGYEGKARVSARRAAGKALIAAGISQSSSLDAIREFQSSPLFPPELTSICTHLLKQVNESYKLDENIDVLADAQSLIDYLNSTEISI